MRRIERELVAAGKSAAPIQIIRVLEAEYGLDTKRLRERISSGARLTRQMSERQRDIYIPWRGVMLVVRDGCIVTVLDSDMGPKSKRGKKRERPNRPLRQVRAVHTTVRLAAGFDCDSG